MSKQENRAMCVHIAKELEAYAAGRMYRCPVCGAAVEPILDESENEEPRYYCPECDAKLEEGDAEPLSLYDWMVDALDIEYRVSGHASSPEYRSASVLVAFGGPNIYIDTATATVQLYWWTERDECPIAPDACAELDAVLEEFFNC